jgi:Na+/proline symporter/nitrogen-specific signal transduction histidine kinase
MLNGTTIVVASFTYIGFLFAIAWYADGRAEKGRSLISSPYVYALSLGVYATAWTFYGSVGRAAKDGVGFLPIYLGPTLMMVLWWFVVRKVIRISKTNRITSLADFVATRYGKSAFLGALVTVMAVICILPYISLQLKAISTSYHILLQYPEIVMPSRTASAGIFNDTAFYIAIFLAGFTIAFGTRQLDVAERHEGMVAAIAFESVVKLVAFVAVGLFVTFSMFDGPRDIFSRASDVPALEALFAPFESNRGSYMNWTWLVILSMAAILFLPRQFQVAVVENVDENHLNKAVWLFPLYMLVINLFVLPIAFGGMIHFQGQAVDADTFVLTLPMSVHQEWLALFVFIGGLSAATGMVIVETIALATMVCNDLAMPLLLKVRRIKSMAHEGMSMLLLDIRRTTIIVVLMLGYFYYLVAGNAYALVSIGLISFAGVAQFGPAIIGGIYWRGATRAGAIAGLSAGFALWAYTLLLPAFVKSGWMSASLVEEGPWGLALFKPTELLGLAGLDQITHAMIWSLLANAGLYGLVSLVTRQSVTERVQATLFVDVFSQTGERTRFWRGTASAGNLQTLLGRFLGPVRAADLFLAYARSRGMDSADALEADGELVRFTEVQLAGAIGGASARTMVASVVKEEPLRADEVMSIIDEASQAIAQSQALAAKQAELERASRELQAANARLTELDHLKDDFISTVTHELRTPLTSIRAFSEILHDNPDIDPAERQRFLGILVSESERLSRLINQVLDLAKLESGAAEWKVTTLDLREVVDAAAQATMPLFKSQAIAFSASVPDHLPPVVADRDRLMQVMMNLLSNASKFCDDHAGRVDVAMAREAGHVRVDVRDNGAGIAPQNQQVIFEKFRQVGDPLTGKPAGTGLGLAICREIVGHFGGRMWVESRPGAGATFSFVLPVASETPGIAE